MYTIIDTIGTYPHATGILKKFPDSVLIVLDREEINKVNDLKGVSVKIVTPVGEVISKKVIFSEAKHGNVGLYLGSTSKDEIPRLSKISW